MNPHGGDNDVAEVLAIGARSVAAPAPVEVGPRVVGDPDGNTTFDAKSAGKPGAIVGDCHGASEHAIVEKRAEVGVMAIADVVAEVDVCNGFRLEVV